MSSPITRKISATAAETKMAQKISTARKRCAVESPVGDSHNDKRVKIDRAIRWVTPESEPWKYRDASPDPNTRKSSAKAVENEAARERGTARKRSTTEVPGDRTPESKRTKVVEWVTPNSTAWMHRGSSSGGSVDSKKPAKVVEDVKDDSPFQNSSTDISKITPSRKSSKDEVSRPADSVDASMNVLKDKISPKNTSFTPASITDDSKNVSPDTASSKKKSSSPASSIESTKSIASNKTSSDESSATGNDSNNEPVSSDSSFTDVSSPSHSIEEAKKKKREELALKGFKIKTMPKPIKNPELEPKKSEDSNSKDSGVKKMLKPMVYPELEAKRKEKALEEMKNLEAKKATLWEKKWIPTSQASNETNNGDSVRQARVIPLEEKELIDMTGELQYGKLWTKKRDAEKKKLDKEKKKLEKEKKKAEEKAEKEKEKAEKKAAKSKPSDQQGQKRKRVDTDAKPASKKTKIVEEKPLYDPVPTAAFGTKQFWNLFVPVIAIKKDLKQPLINAKADLKWVHREAGRCNPKAPAQVKEGWKEATKWFQHILNEEQSKAANAGAKSNGQAFDIALAVQMGLKNIKDKIAAEKDKKPVDDLMFEKRGLEYAVSHLKDKRLLHRKLWFLEREISNDYLMIKDGKKSKDDHDLFRKEESLKIKRFAAVKLGLIEKEGDWLHEGGLKSKD